ncbi:glycoside hydrolase family 43 protein [Lentinula aff. lateritia]|uniref:Glycoside hydrolase family 43 protein n=1 Tax=Lentinula aff. lateritia TaxID=2804960 RepID=A0ACC1TMG1_9AGAR|nr:glycoside hydrolase family 43 protein [Lentinula aff. lateritia]
MCSSCVHRVIKLLNFAILTWSATALANFPDPSVIFTDAYYAFSTTSAGLNVPVATSPDFDTWTYLSHDALPTVGAWTIANTIWAPDVVTVDGGYVLFYAGESAENPGFHCVGVATSTNVEGPYAPQAEPLVCPISTGGAIDPAGFHDVNGDFYLVWKVDGNNIGHGGSCNNGVAPIVPTPIMIQQLTADGTAFAVGSTATEILDRDDNDGPLIEAPSLARSAEGVYFLTFSSNCYSTSLYDVSYATATNVLGPYTKQPWLMITGTPFAQLYAPGGADITPDGDKLVFHADLGTTSDTRQLYTAEITLSGTTILI